MVKRNKKTEQDAQREAKYLEAMRQKNKRAESTKTV